MSNKALEYADSESSWVSGYSGGYDGLVESCDCVASIRKTWWLGSYQGDVVFLLDGEDGRIGYAVEGYGSCSGCDALEACDTRQDIESLRDNICNDVRWFDDIAGLKAYLNDQEINHWYFHDSEWADVKRDIFALEK